jgi:hypothetical protein
MGLLGSVVPIVRCRHHDKVLNLAFDGSIYESGGTWEYQFTNRVSAANLTATNLFADDPPARPAARRRFPARDTNAGPGLINLTKFYNAELTESWLGKANGDLSGLPRGLRKFAGVEFDVRGIVQARSGLLSDKRFPTQVNDIPVRQKCRSLHFLHAAVFGTPADAATQVAAYVVHFTGNQSRVEIPIVYERDVADWHESPDGAPPSRELRIAWTDQPGGERGAPRLFETTWTNLAPDLEVDSIDFVSSMAGPAPFLVAISAEGP